MKITKQVLKQMIMEVLQQEADQDKPKVTFTQKSDGYQIAGEGITSFSAFDHAVEHFKNLNIDSTNYYTPRGEKFLLAKEADGRFYTVFDGGTKMYLKDTKANTN